jgi:hypothetical protein
VGGGARGAGAVQAAAGLAGSAVAQQQQADVVPVAGRSQMLKLCSTLQEKTCSDTCGLHAWQC